MGEQTETRVNSNAPYALCLFGSFRLNSPNGSVVDLPRNQSGALLAMLALRLGQSVSREHILCALWPDDDPTESRRRLRQALYMLRRDLESLAPGLEGALVATRDALLLSAERVTSDAQAFLEELKAAESCADPKEQANRYAAAIALYRGPLLPCFYQERFEEEQRNYADLYYRAMLALPLKYEAAGDLPAAIASARAALAIAPLAEEMHCCLMRLYAACGQPSSVLRQYQEMESILQKELGEKPSLATWELMESLRESGRIVLSAVPPVTAGGKEEAPLQEVTGDDSLPGDLLLTAGENEDRILLETLGAARRSKRIFRRRSLMGMMAGILVVAAFALRLKARPGSETSKLPEKAKKTESVAALSIPLDLPEPHIAWMKIIPLKAGDKSSEPTGVALDPQGNIVVTGFVDTNKTDVDYLIQKIAPNGDLLWQDRYDGISHDVDWARALAIDRSGNIFVSGESDNGKGQGKRRFKGLDIVTLKDSPDGKRLFTARWNGADDGEERLAGMRLDLSGNPYLAVTSYRRAVAGAAERAQIVCLKYDGNSRGNARPAYSVSDLGNDYQETAATDMITELHGNTYIAGYARTGAKQGPDEATVVLKINPQGVLEWEREAGARATGYHSQRVLTGDGFGNIAVSYPVFIEKEGEANFDIGASMFSPGGSILWSREYSAGAHTEDWIICSPDETALAGQYITRGGAPHIFIAGYDRSGHEKWRSRFSALGSSDDGPFCVKMWPATGDIFLTGFSSVKVSKNIFKHVLLTLKLRADGHPEWLSRITPDPKGGSEGRVMALDGHGGVIVAGQADWKGTKAIVVVRYDP